MSEDIRWAVNVLLEKIAIKFEAWDTMDLWRSDAAQTVRGFKHDLAAPLSPQDAPAQGQLNAIADAIEKCDWSNTSIGHKEILKAACAALRDDKE